jgi:hypothetical protein
MIAAWFIGFFVKHVFKLALFLLLVIAVVALWAVTAYARDLVLGDSIAVGTGHALHEPTVALSGASSCWALRHAPKGAYDHVVISAGINDGGGCVARLRARVDARRVIWVLPAPINAGRAAVLAAMRPGDRAISYACRGGCTRSNFHPASYPAVARAVRGVW